MNIFSYHLIKAPFGQVIRRLVWSPALRKVDGLRLSETLITMKMGRRVASLGRYNPRTLALFAAWEDESALDAFLANPPYRVFQNPHWHVRMNLYRTWGRFSGLEEAPLHSGCEGPVVAVTLARLKVRHTLRFAKWGRPVEEQIRQHQGKTCARVAFRPLNTFSTFSIWKSEEEMLGMVRGRQDSDGSQHRNAMMERARKPFHFEFITMRFAPLAEHGDWDAFCDETSVPGVRPLELGARPPTSAKL